MSYRGMGTTATDIAAITTAASTAAAQLIAAGRGGTTPYVTPGSVDPATGMPYTTGMLNPATGMPYGAIDPMTGRPYGEIASDYTIPLVIGGLLVVGIGGYFLMKRGVRANRRRRSSRRVRRNSKRKSSRRNAVRRRSSKAVRSSKGMRKWVVYKSPYGTAVTTPGSRLEGGATNVRHVYAKTAAGALTRGMRRNPSRPLREIAAEIRRDWKNPYFGAVPYLQAMGTLGSVNDSYGYDEGRSIVNYFLSNASGWRGPTAKRVKAELNAALKGR